MPDEDGLFAQLEGLFDEVDKEAPTGYGDLSDIELLDLYEETLVQIREIREILSPRTQEGRDLHSKRGALLIELRTRGINK